MSSAAGQSIDEIMASIRASVGEAPPPPRDDPAVVPPPSRAPAPPAAAEPSLDAYLRAELVPLVKAWLDAHLPEIVEAATHAEIRRLTGRTD